MLQENNFNLPKHLIALASKYLHDFPKNDFESITSKILQEKGRDNGVYELDDLAWWPTEKDMKEKCPQQNQDEHKIAIIKQYLKDFSGNDSEISKDLKEILDNTDFVIAIRPKEKQPTPNGGAVLPNGGAVFKKGNKGEKNKAILMVSEVLFEEQNKDKLPGVLAHEMGHFIDFFNRPQGDSIKLKYMDGAETYADIMGVIIAKNAGYNCDGWANFLQTKSEEGFNPPHTHSGIHRAKTIYECSAAYDAANKKHQEKATQKNTGVDKIQQLRGISSFVKDTDKPQMTTVDINTLHLYQSKKQND